MIGKILLAGVGLATGASLSEGTKRQIKDAARGVRNDFIEATKGVRAQARKGWDGFTQYLRKDLDPPPSDPPAPA